MAHTASISCPFQCIFYWPTTTLERIVINLDQNQTLTRYNGRLIDYWSNGQCGSPKKSLTLTVLSFTFLSLSLFLSLIYVSLSLYYLLLKKKKNLHRLQAKKKKKKEGKWRTKMLLLAYSHILSPSQSYLPHPHAYLHLCSDSPLFLVDEANPQLFHGFCESLFSSSSKIFQILLFVTQIQVFLLSLFLFSILIFFFLITGIVNLMVILILH